MTYFLNYYGGNVFFSPEATELYLWSKEEPNRIKASKLMEVARKLEYAWRKIRNDKDSFFTRPLPNDMISREELQLNPRLKPTIVYRGGPELMKVINYKGEEENA